MSAADKDPLPRALLLQLLLWCQRRSRILCPECCCSCCSGTNGGQESSAPCAAAATVALVPAGVRIPCPECCCCNRCSDASGRQEPPSPCAAAATAALVSAGARISCRALLLQPLRRCQRRARISYHVRCCCNRMQVPAAGKNPCPVRCCAKEETPITATDSVTHATPGP